MAWTKSSSERNKSIISARCAGRTLASIGDEFGITRERVRQILAVSDKKNGTNLSHDAKRVRASRSSDRSLARLAAAQEKRSRKARGLYGCSYETLKTINPGPRGADLGKHSPARKYIEHKKSARRRGIEFQLTLVEWWKVIKHPMAERKEKARARKRLQNMENWRISQTYNLIPRCLREVARCGGRLAHVRSKGPT